MKRTDMPPESAGPHPIHSLSFEDALTMLQDVVVDLESGSLTLDETIERFRQGTELASHCQALIAEAELRITELAPAGEPESRETDDEPPF
jgi:exodeoxyribonuclease VII small subunit